MEFNLNITFVSPNLELNLHLFDIQFVKEDIHMATVHVLVALVDRG